MKSSKRFLLLLSFVFTGTLLFSSCSKDKEDHPDPTDPVETSGTASATVLFTDTQKSLDFKGTAVGSIARGEQGDTVALYISGKNTPSSFFLILVPAKKGRLSNGENGFSSMGWFMKDSAQSSLFTAYLLGAENFPEAGNIEDAATYNITSISKDRIKGTFTATMILNSTVVEDGEIISGEIKTLKVTKGKFDVPLFSGSNLAVR